MADINTQDSTYFIPIDKFVTCKIDSKTRREIISLFSKREDGAYYLNKFNKFLQTYHNIDLKNYCVKYLNIIWPKCPVTGCETGFHIDGKGITISKFKKGKTTKKYCPAFAEACDKFSTERMGKNNPMYGKKPWNKDLNLDDPRIKRISDMRKGMVISDETKKRQSESAKKRKIHGHTGVTHTEETKKILSEITSKRYEDGKYNKKSNLQTKVENFLNKLQFIEQFKEEYFLKYYSLDFAFPGAKVCIECQGTFFHIDPRIYPNGPICAIQRRNFGRDKAKRRFLENLGWTLIEIWETEINDNSYESYLICKLKELNLLKS